MSAWDDPSFLAKTKSWLTWGGYTIAFIGLVAAVTGEFVSKRIDGILHPPLEIRFRNLLAEIHPDITKAVDSGKSEFSVLVDDSNVARLSALMREDGFDALASIRFGSKTMASVGVSFGEDFRDRRYTGGQTLCAFRIHKPKAL
jgi:hypothetical protein